MPKNRYEIKLEPEGTPQPTNESEQYLELRIQALEKESNQRHWIIEAALDKMAKGRIGRYDFWDDEITKYKTRYRTQRQTCRNYLHKI
jgi:hypothetical protein